MHSIVSLNLPTFQNSAGTGAEMKIDTECADDIPTSVLVLHSLTDNNQDEDT
jgi:hypothetical protein